MVINLSEKNSLVSCWMNEIRDSNIQTDRMRFRHNLERIGEIAAYEISKRLQFESIETPTALGIASGFALKQQPVLATILRAGLPLHQGLLNYFDKADNAFISAYRKHNRDGSFQISLEYVSCPDLTDRVLIIADPMIATGASLVKTIHHLKNESTNISIIGRICSFSCFMWNHKNIFCKCQKRNTDRRNCKVYSKRE
jgi:uracil phosphoribosyltransferase